MELLNIINGEEVRKCTFVSNGLSNLFANDVKTKIFSNGPYSVSLPSLDSEIAGKSMDALNSAKIPPLKDRREIISSLDGYNPRPEILKAISNMSGTPMNITQELVNKGKELSTYLSQLDSKEISKKNTSYVGIPANDPREVFYFISHALLAGSPMILKPSSQEPVLANDVVKYLCEKSNLPRGLLNVVYANTKNSYESGLLKKMMESVDIPIIMGDTKISPRQISFNADHSKGLILDADLALPHLATSVYHPLSCLAEHNYLILGDENYNKVIQNLISIYTKLRRGDLNDPETNMYLVDLNVIKSVSDILSNGCLFGTINLIYPNNIGKLELDLLNSGIIAEHYAEDLVNGMNPLMTTSLPLYFTGLRKIDHIDDALVYLHAANREIKQNSGADKIMALGVYGDPKDNLKEKLEELAYDVSFNKSPFEVNGVQHQGINLNKELTKN